MKKNNIDDITKKLEEGVKDIFNNGSYEQFLAVMAKFHNYSFNNCVLIAIQMPEATRVAGFKSWENNFKRHVKKGAKAIKILAPIPRKYQKEVEDADGNKVVKEISYTAFRAVPVFDISQTEGEELPTICKRLEGSVNGFADLIAALEKLSPVPVEYNNIQGSANGFYSHADKKIVVDAGLSEQHKVKTLIHEITHAILHNKDTGIAKEADSRTKEVQAESVAYTVCNWLGFDTSDYSFGYVAAWSEGKEAKELSESMDIIRMTAGEIIDSLDAVA